MEIVLIIVVVVVVVIGKLLHAQLHGNVLTNLEKEEKNLMLNYCKTSSRAVFFCVT